MFRKTARNFNQPAATCGKICVAEVEEIVPVGSLDPDCIHVPGIYVKRLILGAPYDKKIEFRDRAARGRPPDAAIGGGQRCGVPTGDRSRRLSSFFGAVDEMRAAERGVDRLDHAAHRSVLASSRYAFAGAEADSAAVADAMRRRCIALIARELA